MGVLIMVLYAGVGAPSAPEEDEAREELAGEED
jgi:hypothetical protein